MEMIYAIMLLLALPYLDPSFWLPSDNIIVVSTKYYFNSHYYIHTRGIFCTWFPKWQVPLNRFLLLRLSPYVFYWIIFFSTLLHTIAGPLICSRPTAQYQFFNCVIHNHTLHFIWSMNEPFMHRYASLYFRNSTTTSSV